MKNAIQLFAILIFVSAGTSAFAQTVGIKAGLNLSNLRAADDDINYSEDFKTKLGFHAGVTAEFPVSEMFSIETGLMLSTKGTRVIQEGGLFGFNIEIKQNLNLYYLDIPINARVNIPVGGSKIFVTAGPYVGFGIVGNNKYKETVDGNVELDESTAVSWGNDENEDDFKRLDLGIAAGAGIQISAVEIGLSYALGLSNTTPYSNNGFKSTNRVLSVSVGYKFNQ